MDQYADTPAKSETTAAASFIELRSLPVGTASECVIE